MPDLLRSREKRPKSQRHSIAGLALLEIIEQAADPVDVTVLVVDVVKGTRKPHRVPGIVALIELLAARERRHRGVKGQAKQLYAIARIGVGRLEVGFDVLTDGSGQL